MMYVVLNFMMRLYIKWDSKRWLIVYTRFTHWMMYVNQFCIMFINIQRSNIIIVVNDFPVRRVIDQHGMYVMIFTVSVWV